MADNVFFTRSRVYIHIYYVRINRPRVHIYMCDAQKKNRVVRILITEAIVIRVLNIRAYARERNKK